MSLDVLSEFFSNQLLSFWAITLLSWYLRWNQFASLAQNIAYNKDKGQEPTMLHGTSSALVLSQIYVT